MLCHCNLTYLIGVIKWCQLTKSELCQSCDLEKNVQEESPRRVELCLTFQILEIVMLCQWNLACLFGGVIKGCQLTLANSFPELGNSFD